MDNPTLWVCGLLCGIPAFITMTIITGFRLFAKRRPTIHIEHTRIPIPDATPDISRLAIYLDLQERQPRLPKDPEEEKE